MVLVAGCKDKAEPKFREAEAAQKTGNVIEAVSLYKQATQADPTSTLGKQAAERVAELSPLAEKEQQRIDEENEKRRAAEAAAARVQYEATLASAKRVVTVARWEINDDRCAAAGLPRRGYRFSGGTDEQNEMVATSLGCQKRNWYDKFERCCP